jgi:hypothetical protein
MLGSEALSATTWCYRFSMETTPNVDDVLSGRPGRPGNWAVELGGPKPFRTKHPNLASRWVPDFGREGLVACDMTC